MSDAIVILQIEHTNIARVLDIVESQTTKMAENEPVNFQLLEGSFEYLIGFPDRCHHPKEDLLYRTLVERFPELAEPLKDLVAEHKNLAHTTRYLRRAAGEIRFKQIVDAELVERLRAFLEDYRRHMFNEEQYFFPAVLERLSRDELAHIDFTLFDLPDHIFDQDAEPRLAALHDAITKLDADEQSTSTNPRSDAAWLASVKDVATFNEAMRRDGHRLSLSRSEDGGYVLRRKEEVLVHIPACGELRAAWCAYFFNKASSVNAATAPSV